MKKEKGTLKALSYIGFSVIFVFSLMIIAGCGGGGGGGGDGGGGDGEPINDSTLNATLFEVQQSPDTDLAWVLENEDGAKIAVLSEKDINGYFQKVIGGGYILPSDESLWFWLGDDGRPNYVETEGWVFRFYNYTETTVDIISMSPDGDVNQHIGLPFDSDLWAEIPSLNDYGKIGNPPLATITSPSNDIPFTIGDNINFSGTGEDSEDGTLTSSSMVWTSSIDGQIGSGKSFTKNDLSNGSHIITLKVYDSDGNVSSDQITIVVNCVVKPDDLAGDFYLEIDRDCNDVIYESPTVSLSSNYSVSEGSYSGSWSLDGDQIAFSYKTSVSRLGMHSNYNFTGTLSCDGNQMQGTMSRSQFWQRCYNNSCTSESPRTPDPYSGCWSATKEEYLTPNSLIITSTAGSGENKVPETAIKVLDDVSNGLTAIGLTLGLVEAPLVTIPLAVVTIVAKKTFLKDHSPDWVGLAVNYTRCGGLDKLSCLGLIVDVVKLSYTIAESKKESFQEKHPFYSEEEPSGGEPFIDVGNLDTIWEPGVPVHVTLPEGGPWDVVAYANAHPCVANPTVRVLINGQIVAENPKECGGYFESLWDVVSYDSAAEGDDPYPGGTVVSLWISQGPLCGYGEGLGLVGAHIYVYEAPSGAFTPVIELYDNGLNCIEEGWNPFYPDYDCNPWIRCPD